MSLIDPNSTVLVLKNVNCDSGYNHTIYFEDESTQSQYFSSKVKYTLPQQSYQRVDRGSIRVEILCDNLYDCNYMMFKNTEFGNKWFYAFINDVTYINNNCTEIHYTLDVMQTWYFDYTLGKCFVEREHVDSDGLAEHVIPEPINGGTYTYKSKRSMQFTELGGESHVNNPWSIVIAAKGFTITPTPLYTLEGTIAEGLYTPYVYHITEIHGGGTQADLDDITEFIEHVTDDNGVIMFMAAVPTSLIATVPRLGVREYNITVSQSEYFAGLKSLHTYKPRNRKLYTSQYNYLTVSDNHGNSNKFEWEKFYGVDYTGSFVIKGGIHPTPEIVCYPTYYANADIELDTGVPYINIPYLAWDEDSFKRWWAQNKTSFSIQTIGSALGIVAGIASGQYWVAAAGAASLAQSVGEVSRQAQTPSTVSTQAMNPQSKYVMPMYRGNITNETARQNALGMRMTAIESNAKLKGVGDSIALVTNALSTLASAANLTDTIKGGNTGGTLDYANSAIGYTFYDVGVCAEEAEIIDNYFDMFGYQVDAIKVPNVRGGGGLRPKWNYIKTATCVIHPATGKGMPQDDEDAIANIYNAGITFWMNGDEVGEYDGDENMLSEEGDE